MGPLSPTNSFDSMLILTQLFDLPQQFGITLDRGKGFL